MPAEKQGIQLTRTGDMTAKKKQGIQLNRTGDMTAKKTGDTDDQNMGDGS